MPEARARAVPAQLAADAAPTPAVRRGIRKPTDTTTKHRPASRGTMGAMPPRVLVVDKSASTRDVIAELLGDLASDVAWVAPEGAIGLLRNGPAVDVIVLDAEPAPTPALVRELSSAGGHARVV